MKIVYIAHPISGEVEKNLFRIRRIVRNINLVFHDVVPFVPYYVDCVSMDDSDKWERERGIRNDTAILKSGIVNEMWLYGKRISEGMKAEIKLAASLGIPITPQSQETRDELQTLFPDLTPAEENKP